MVIEDIDRLKIHLRAEKSKMTYDFLAHKYDVNKFYLWHLLNDCGYVPPPSVAKKLGIEIYASVIPLNGSIPSGSQSLGARFCINCKQPFISNHPRRRKCFSCSPCRKKK